MEKLVKVAFLYDFDLTLSPRNMQEYSFQDLIGTTKDEWWKDVNEFGKNHNMDGALAMMFKLITVAKEKGIVLKKQDIVNLGKDIEYFDGVETWFKRLTDYARTLGLDLKHYIISSGLKEIIEGTSIAHNFHRIFASCFAYDNNDIPFWPSQSVNYTTKTQYIYRVRKNAIDDLYNASGVNEYIKSKEELVPYENMVYFGDGITDIPSMRTISKKGGNSICVYAPNSEKSYKECRKLYLERRSDFLAPADYREGTPLDNICKNILNKIASYIDNE
ncbi:MAG: haloacid dehalogenase-like hydrolase [Clostridia bacterium]|nr:haloacid dehalogenase-like hydrolase [Clostridia bacterium]